MFDGQGWKSGHLRLENCGKCQTIYSELVYEPLT